jgi:C4-type Zn-finger protein
MTDDQGYTTTLEGFIARFDDLASRLRDAVNGGDDIEVHELLDELEDELARAGDFIKTKRE